MKSSNLILGLIKNIKNPIGIEIGVCNGTTSFYLLDNKNDLTLYGVDPYFVYDDVNPAHNKRNRDGINKQEMYDGMYNAVKGKLAKYGNRSILLRDISENAVKNFNDNFFDFVFIDGCHLYEFVKKDILFWTPKIKNNGILCGHDYNLNNNHKENVCKAVNELVKNFKVESDTFWWIKL